jgi:Domain of unknown function (DUF3883)
MGLATSPPGPGWALVKPPRLEKPVPSGIGAVTQSPPCGSVDRRARRDESSRPGQQVAVLAKLPVRWEHQTVALLSGNKAIEDAAITWVMGLERAAGRRPRDTRYEKDAPADIESPPRLIEVKSFSTSNRGYDLWLEVSQVEEAKINPDFYVYAVENVRQGDPNQFTLRVLGGDRLRHLLEQAKEQRYYTVPSPVADYDTCPGLDG